jgi:hypothetical protein
MISSNWAKAGALSANSEVDTARAVKPLKVLDDICVSPYVIYQAILPRLKKPYFILKKCAMEYSQEKYKKMRVLGKNWS